MDHEKVLCSVAGTGLGVALGRMFDNVQGVSQASGLQGNGGGTAENGDANGDGARDLSDAIHLLSWLFQGGPDPVPCPTGGGGAAGLPATGATTCFDDNGPIAANEIDCGDDGAPCFGQDAFYATGCSSAGRYTDNGDSTVTDNCTGLMWQKDTGNEGTKLDWCAALAYCEGLSLGGHDDWRLPNIHELQSIVDYGYQDPAIHPVFSAPMSALDRDPVYWSSTTTGIEGPANTGARDVNFEVGNSGNGLKSGGVELVRAVRTAP